MRPGRMSAGSSFSGWLVVMMTMRLGLSTTPSSTLSSPARSSRSSSSSSDLSRSSFLGGPSSITVTTSSTSSTAPVSALSTASAPSAPSASFSASFSASLLPLGCLDSPRAGSSGASHCGAPASDGEAAPGDATAVACLLGIVPAAVDALVALRTTVRVTVRVAAAAGARRCTTLLAASTSSITKITFANSSDCGKSAESSSPLFAVLTTLAAWSNMMSVSSWFVLILESGTLTMCRPV
mmetsp:Transcript_39395/g.118958  ORF Transcript_39395/g.118958 Transcript_39395/m.118958 type:complete len:239 (+) Transcript_39395:898-1614(+)